MAKCMDGVDVDIHGFDDHSMPMRDRRVQPQVDSGQHGIAGGLKRSPETLAGKSSVAAIAQRRLNVVVDVEIGNEIEALEDEADLLVARYIPAKDYAAARAKS